MLEFFVSGPRDEADVKRERDNKREDGKVCGEVILRMFSSNMTFLVLARRMKIKIAINDFS